MPKKTPDTAAPQKSQRRLFQEYSEALVMAVILAILIRSLLVQAFKIPSSSMEDTLLVGDHILVAKFVYGLRIPFTNIRWPNLHGPKRDDVIVFIFPEDRTKDFIKRVVAVGGETVQIVNKRVFVNGEEVSTPHAKFTDPRMIPKNLNARDTYGPYKVPEDRLFVMGDNRDHSHDSRFWGFVPVKDVRGKAFIIYYSANPFPEIRWARLLNRIR
ncbi:MAG: signal peptidase I [Thermodesulfobacteriota bacterium]